MDEKVLKNLDNDSLMELLYELENLDLECDKKINEIRGGNDE